MTGFGTKVDEFFGISERGSTISTEVKGGVITFLAMFYILAVNPSILSVAAGAEMFEQLATATALAAGISCILMGLYAKFPVALAPGMGINAFVAYTIVTGMGFTYPQALLAVLFSGILFFITSLTGFRRKLISEIPQVLRLGITAGIGFFIFVVGLYNAGVVQHGVGSALAIGNLASPGVALSLLCMAITLVLWYRNNWGAVLIGLVVTVIVGFIGGQFFGWDTAVEGASIIPGVGTAAITNIINIPDLGLVGVVFTGFEGLGPSMIPALLVATTSLLIVDMFDTTGTLLGIGQSAGILDAEGEIVGNGKALEADAVASVIGATVGTSTTTSFIESTTGIVAGARTGLMAVVVGILFFFAMFFAPLMVVVTSACTVGALFIVGISMIATLKDVHWGVPVNMATVFMTLFMMGVTGSITDGIAFGTFTYMLGMIFTKRTSEVTKTMWIITVVFLAYFLVTFIVIPMM